MPFTNLFSGDKRLQFHFPLLQWMQNHHWGIKRSLWTRWSIPLENADMDSGNKLPNNVLKVSAQNFLPLDGFHRSSPPPWKKYTNFNFQYRFFSKNILKKIFFKKLNLVFIYKISQLCLTFCTCFQRNLSLMI